jgi:hypothetical protein
MKGNRLEITEIDRDTFERIAPRRWASKKLVRKHGE